MSQDSPTDDDFETDDDSPTTRELRSQLKAANKASREMEAKLEAGAAAQRRIAFLDAGIPDTPQAKFFRDNYSGDLDPEVIKTVARDNGFLDSAPDPGTQSIDAQSSAAFGAEGNIAMGSDEEMLREIEEAGRTAPRGFTSQAIADVFKKHNRHPQY